MKITERSPWVHTIFLSLVVLLAETVGQHLISYQFDQRMAQIQAEYRYSQHFYESQLRSLADGLRRLSKLRVAAKLSVQGNSSAGLRDEIAKWSQWKQENELYMSRVGFKKADQVWTAAIYLLTSPTAEHGETETLLTKFRQRAEEMRSQMRKEAQHPIEFLGGRNAEV